MISSVEAATAVDVILRDGTTLRLRPPAARRRRRPLAFFEASRARASTSASTAASRVTPALVEPLLEPDWDERGALVGELGRAGSSRSRATSRLRDPAAAESAFAVADDLQGRGRRHAPARAARRAAPPTAGIERFVAEVLPENAHDARASSRDVGFERVAPARGRRDRGRVPDRADRALPRARRRARPRRRRRVARPFFEPQSVAVDRRLAHAASRSAASSSATSSRATSPAPPTRSTCAASRSPASAATRSVEEIPDPSTSPSSALPGGARARGGGGGAAPGRPRARRHLGRVRRGRERGRRARSSALLELVRAHGARLIGPNCLGIAVRRRAAERDLRAARSCRPGTSASRRRAARSAWRCSRRPAERGLGLSAVRLDRQQGGRLLERPARVVGGRRRRPTSSCSTSSRSATRAASARVARRVARKKPMLALKSGTTRAGARAASSHTAALAGSEAAVEALFRQAGVHPRRDARGARRRRGAALEPAAAARAAGSRVLTNAGGLGILAADACEAAGLELPRARRGDRDARCAALLPREASVANPVDMLGSATAATYEAALPTLLADPGIDAVIVALRAAGRRRRRRRSRRRSRGACASAARTSRCSPS